MHVNCFRSLSVFLKKTNSALIHYILIFSKNYLAKKKFICILRLLRSNSSVNTKCHKISKRLSKLKRLLTEFDKKMRIFLSHFFLAKEFVDKCKIDTEMVYMTRRIWITSERNSSDDHFVIIAQSI